MQMSEWSFIKILNRLKRLWMRYKLTSITSPRRHRMEVHRIYPATVKRVIDGDSVILDFDVGFNLTKTDESCRLWGIDTAEIRGGLPETKAIGLLAKDYVKGMLPVGASVIAKTHRDKKGKFGRYLAQIEVGGIEINQTLLDRRLAIPYFGGSKDQKIEKHLENYEHHLKKGSFSLTARI